MQLRMETLTLRITIFDLNGGGHNGMSNSDYNMFMAQLTELTAEYFANEENAQLFEQWKREKENGN